MIMPLFMSKAYILEQTHPTVFMHAKEMHPHLSCERFLSYSPDLST